MQVVYILIIIISLVGLVACSESTPTFEPAHSPLSSTQKSQANLLSPPFTATSKASFTPTLQHIAGNKVLSTPAANLTEPYPGVQIWAGDIRREGNYASASVCYDLPDDSDWMIDQAIFRYNRGEASLDSAGLLELVPLSLDGKEGHRCDEVTFIIPDQADLSHVTLTVERLRAIPNEGEYCDIYLNKVQPTLDARQAGIKLECTRVDHGYKLSVLEKPDSLSQEEAERAVYDFYTISGPWTFQFNELPNLIFDPLPYKVKANASNFQREGDLIKIDVCFQIDNNDWDAWQVQEGIIQYAGQEDRSFGTTAQLNRISPANAKIVKYCGSLEDFPNLGEMPVDAKASDFTLTITSLIPVINNSNLCSTYLGQVQKQLDRQLTGIRVQCGRSATGEYVLQSVDLPGSVRLSQAAMERVLANVGLFASLQGPWTFVFK